MEITSRIKKYFEVSQGQRKIEGELVQVVLFIEHIKCCLLAGISVYAAFSIAARGVKAGRVKEILQRILEGSKLGLSFKQALENAARDCALHELKSALEMLTTALENGSSSTAPLVVLKERIWETVVDSQMSQIAKMPVKLLMPITIFLLPAVVVVLCSHPLARLLENLF